MVLAHIVEHAILVCQFRVCYMLKSWRREPGLFGNRFLEACGIRIMQPLLLPSTASEWLSAALEWQNTGGHDGNWYFPMPSSVSSSNPHGPYVVFS